MAHKLARILYAMLTTRPPYDETKAAEADAKQKQRQLDRIAAKAKHMGYQLVPIPA